MVERPESLGEDEIFFDTRPWKSDTLFSSPDSVKWIQIILTVAEAETGLKVDGIYGPHTREAILRFQENYGLDADGVVGPITAIALAQSAINYIYQQSLVPINGIMDETTTEAVKIFQSSNMLVPDGVIGPTTMAAMTNSLVTLEQPSMTASPTAQQEWDMHPRIHRHFRQGFQTYLDLRDLYQQLGIENPAQYLDENIINLKFFGHSTPAHADLNHPLELAESSLQNQGILPSIQSFWAFVPRRISGTNKLSNHSLGRAIDINPASNPHIKNKDDIGVIYAATGIDLGQEQNTDAIRGASIDFMNTFNQSWIDAQSYELRQIIAKRRNELDGYALNGFFDLEQSLIDVLISVGFSWGGSWIHSKDLMHFEIR